MLLAFWDVHYVYQSRAERSCRRTLHSITAPLKVCSGQAAICAGWKVTSHLLVEYHRLLLFLFGLLYNHNFLLLLLLFLLVLITAMFGLPFFSGLIQHVFRNGVRVC